MAAVLPLAAGRGDYRVHLASNHMKPLFRNIALAHCHKQRFAGHRELVHLDWLACEHLTSSGYVLPKGELDNITRPQEARCHRVPFPIAPDVCGRRDRLLERGNGVCGLRVLVPFKGAIDDLQGKGGTAMSAQSVWIAFTGIANQIMTGMGPPQA